MGRVLEQNLSSGLRRLGGGQEELAGFETGNFFARIDINLFRGSFIFGVWMIMLMLCQTAHCCPNAAMQ